MTNYYELSLDFSLSLEERMENFHKLDKTQTDNLLETLCSVYNIHPTFLHLQYLQILLLQDNYNIIRRIRIAEISEMNHLALFLLSRVRDIRDRISCIEMFTNPYLKFHSYCVLYKNVNLNTQIQIMKNIYSIYTISKQYRFKILDWFIEQMENTKLDYILRTNCADFVLLKDNRFKERSKAKTILNIDGNIMDIYEHKENVHLFVPKLSVLEKILTSKKAYNILETEIKIVNKIREKGRDINVFKERILNDKTSLGSIKHKTTLRELFFLIWLELTDDLKDMILDDIYSSEENKEEGWMCTTGYYNRIINIYQALYSNETFFTWNKLEEKENFAQKVIDEINKILFYEKNMDDILLEMTEDSLEKRIKFMSFKVNILPKLINEFRQNYPEFTQDEFDELFSYSLRKYEAIL